MNNELAKAYEDLLRAVEEVLGTDWDYTREMLGISIETLEQRKAKADRIAQIFGEEPDYEFDTGTFLEPSISMEVACRDWGNRAILLEAYQRLRTLTQP